MHFLDTPFFNEDLYKMAFRILINLVALTLIIRYLYYPKAMRKDYVFTYYLVGTTVFLICFTLKKLELNIGMALGLFAIFGIIRYRTNAIPIKEMTYLFVVIGISVVNSLINEGTSYAEVLMGNFLVIGTIYFVEYLIFPKIRCCKEIVYDRMENICPDKHNILREELEKRIGHSIDKIKIKKLDFYRNRAKIIIYYCATLS